MPTRCRVVLCGSSLVLAGVGQSLEQHYPRFEVLSLEASGEDAARALDALCPSAVILDLSTMTTAFAFSLLDNHPDLLLIGLDPGGNGLLLLSGQQARQLTSEDLAHFIDRSFPREQGEATTPSTHQGGRRP
ncbi:MAG: hypothetical protein ACOX3S_05335 [Anaerolineae bacterium]|jgi:DNA-binding NarL/FixJ family response regulator